MSGVSQFRWIVPSLVYANAELVYTTPMQLLDHGCSGFVGFVHGDKVGWQGSFIGSEFLCQRLERGAWLQEESFICA